MVASTDPLLAEIQRQLDADIDLSGLAERFGYSPYHFHRVFTRSVGETPRGHIARLRLEKALLLVVASEATFLDIALAVGFRNHETFTRAFKRQFGTTPRELRREARQVERKPPDRLDEEYSLSKARFAMLPARHMLAVRHIGSYDEPFALPYLPEDTYWNGLVAWAEAHDLGHSRLPYGFFLDMPGITPDAAMRADFAIEIEREVTPDGRYFYLPFDGGTFGVIEHRGPHNTLPQAYRALVNAIFAVPEKYVLSGAPPFQVHREVHVDGDPADNLTEVYFPDTRA
ncbi:helix-turn-helix domain-containing protein [Altererythrobacter salegens]|uniref:Helix-turn-helix domain-containing protein n=1 Tax=Croceibacterium salegens TaxID=1737568 RepID=A0A6I4T147_9SPHN|nr:helix-turn-helix domain-containing protein [Croceibacterium salegens]MXO61090.1 helix-turn-helix domain-containing protein [Croceibacterium salegens]